MSSRETYPKFCISADRKKKYENENYNLLPCFEIFLFLTYAKISKQTGKGNTQNKITKLEHTGPDIHDITVESFVELLLYGHSSLNESENKKILIATLEYIYKTKRFAK